MMREAFPSAAGRAANHCDALLKRRAAPRELGHDFELFGERLAGAMRQALSARQVRSLGMSALSADELPKRCGPLCANSVHAFGDDGKALLLSFDGRALLVQLDRALGGTGEIGKSLPAELPLSADLLAHRLEKQAASAVAGELAGLSLHSGRRGPSVAELAPFPPDAALTLLELEVTGDADAPWRIVLAVETDALPILLPRGASAHPQGGAQRKADAGSAPFADLPLTASATLVDMAVPLHRFAGLAPGDVLPIMVARSVPLQIGDTTLARGTVGEVDKQIALQITQTSFGKDTQ
jgi:flagellar motor switch protein FliM